MSYQYIIVQKNERITEITINRPAVMNALHPDANLELDDAFNTFQDDPEQWVAIITGAGTNAFSAGNDLKYQAQHGSGPIRSMRSKLRGGFGGLVNRFDCYKPIIAAVNGFALGGGFEIALACDLIVASESASFGLPEPRVGLMAGAGGTNRLPRQIPYHVAMAVLLAGQRLSAKEAMMYGLVNEITVQEALMDRARWWASEVLRGAPLSVQATKEHATRTIEMPLDRAVGSVFPRGTVLYESEDLIEGPKAFAEKRPPQWKGR